MKKILYILITFGVIGGGVFGGILSEQVPKSTYNVLSFSYLAIVVLGYIILFGKKKTKKTATKTTAPQKTASAGRSSTQASRPAQATTQQHPQQATPKTTPKAAPQTATKNKSGEGLIFQDFFTAIPGAGYGLLIGFILFLVFGLIASLTSAHSITNTFGKIAVLCLFGCTITGYIGSLRQQPKNRKEKAERKAAAQMLEQQILGALKALDTVSPSTKEGAECYGKACDFLVYAFSTYYTIPECTEVANKHRHKCYERTHPYYEWNSRTFQYEYVPGTELAEEIQKAFRRATEEREAFYNKK